MATRLRSRENQEYTSGFVSLAGHYNEKFDEWVQSNRDKLYMYIFWKCTINPEVGEDHVEDVLHDTLETLAQSKTYDPSRGNHLSFAKAIARNKIKELIRLKHRIVVVTSLENQGQLDAEDEEQDYPDLTLAPVGDILEHLQVIIKVLSQIDPDDKCLLKLHICGLSGKQIALELRVSHDVVRQRMRRLKEKLQQFASE